MLKHEKIKVFETVHIGYKCLERSDRRRYLFYVGLQTVLSVIDLMGIAILAFVVSSIASLDRNTSAPIGLLNRLMPAENWPLRDKSSFILTLVSVSLILFILKSTLAIYISRINLRSLSLIAIRKSMELTKAFFGSDIQKLRSQSSQNFAQGLSVGVNALYLDSLSTMAIIVSEGFLLLVLVLTFFLVDFWITLALAFYFLIVFYILQRKISGIAQKSGDIKYKSSILDMQLIQDGIESYRELYVAGGIELEIKKIERVRRSALHGLVNWQWVNLLPKYILEIALITGVLLATTIGYFMDVSNDFELISIFLIASTRMLPSLLRLQQAVSILVSAQPPVLAYLEIQSQISTTSLNRANKSSFKYEFDESLLLKPPQIRLENVSFKYVSSGKNVVSGLDLTINSGEFVALIGGSGAGKSTLMDMMLGIVEPTTGQVTVSMMPPRDLIAKNPGLVGYVPQKSRLMNATLVENISQNDIASTQEERDIRVWQLLQILDLDADVKKMPRGIYENLGEHGSRLSGGQLQRISLARALYSDPKLLMLDEATNSLDSRTEAIILKVLLGLTGKTTIVTIAHRVSMMKSCDRLILLSNGKIRSQGKFEELSLTDNGFRKLLRLQE